MITPAFWSNRRVFLTGHTGFKGSWLSLMLARLGACVTGFALAPPTRPNLFELADVGRDLRDLRGDVTDRQALADAVAAADPEIIFHMAAQSLVKAGYADPVGTYLANVMGTVHLLEAARASSRLKAVVIVTSDKCYDNREWIWGYRETDPLGGRDPYSNSKACAELATAAYRQSFFSGQEGAAVILSARSGNVIGGGDFAADRIVPDAMRAFAAGRTLLVRNPGAIRPWQHVLDPLHGYLVLAERAFAGAGTLFSPGEPFSAWNFGPDPESEQDVATLAGRLCEAWGSDAAWAVDQGRHAHEAHLLRLDASKARRRLRWRPILSFDAMVEWTVGWHRALAAGSDMPAWTREQTDRFLALRPGPPSPSRP